MNFLTQPPVWSPLSLRALLAGFWAAWLTDGSTARRNVAQLLGAAYQPRDLYLLDSGTSALTVALQAAHALTRAPVALPAYCCYDIATAADGAAAPFYLYDVDPSSLSPDLPSLRRAFESGAKSVVVAHLYGVPADLEGTLALASEYGAVVIEDAAQGSGCELQGKPAGAHGALGVLSFGRGKGVTGGKGGALLVYDARLLDAVSAGWRTARGPRTPRGSLRDFLLLKAQWLFGRPLLYWIPASLPFLRLGETTYRAPHPVGGVSALAAGVLGRTIRLVPAEAGVRRKNASRLRAELRDVSLVHIPPGWEAGWLRFPIVLQRTATDVLREYHSRGGVVGGYPSSLADLPGFGARRLNPNDEFPGARVLAGRLVTLPTHRFVRSTGSPAF